MIKMLDNKEEEIKTGASVIYEHNSLQYIQGSLIMYNVF